MISVDVLLNNTSVLEMTLHLPPILIYMNHYSSVNIEMLPMCSTKMINNIYATQINRKKIDYNFTLKIMILEKLALVYKTFVCLITNTVLNFSLIDMLVPVLDIILIQI